jgi:sensor histidine kinase regulating citrate/malate metabolism
VLRSLSGQAEKLNAYIDTLTAKIPAGDVKLCENYAVNAVAAYYNTLARQAGIPISVALTVPEELDGEMESDLCVVVGNLMENAAEACKRMESGDRFIRVGSQLHHGTLALAVDNSFTGKLQKQDGALLSSKRQGEGTGTSSVKAVARKYGGDARFEEKEGVFQASVYMRIM